MTTRVVFASGRALAGAHAAVDDFLATRARVRAAVDALLGAAAGSPPEP